MKIGDLVRRAFYGTAKPTFLEEDGVGLIIDMCKPSGHRNYRCTVLWWTGKISKQSIEILRRFK